MKGIILAAGEGKRIREVTTNKCLTAFNGKSLIMHSIEKLYASRYINECIIVVGKNHQEIRRNIGQKYKEMPISYCIQKESRGLIDALACSSDLIVKEDFFMVLGDEYVHNEDYTQFIQKYKTNKMDCLIGYVDMGSKELVKKTYAINFDEDSGKVKEFIEKPINPKNSYVGTGNVIFSNYCLGRIKDIPINPIRRERDLVGLFNLLLSEKSNIGIYNIAENYINLNTIEDWERLRKIEREI